MRLLFCDRETPALTMGMVHVYVRTLQPAAEECWLHLSEGERQRAARFRLPRVREQFVQTRGVLRTLLGAYLDTEPGGVPIVYGDNGKPHLPAACGLHFNVSHTEGLAVFAFCQQRVGVDVERQRPFRDALGLVQRFFSPRECALFENLAEGERPDAFFRAWTRKEAVLKAIGRGVQVLDCCDVTFHKDEPPQVLRLDDDERASEQWSLFAWEPAHGYIGALAVERPP